MVLATDGFYRTAMASTEIGQTSYYKAIISGGDWDDAAQTSLKYNAASLRCSHQFISSDPRRFRQPDPFVGTPSALERRMVDSIDVPLFEDTTYEVDILNGEIIVRTITASATSATCADQTTDFGVAQSVLSVAVYQISSTIGRGYAGKATV